MSITSQVRRWRSSPDRIRLEPRAAVALGGWILVAAVVAVCAVRAPLITPALALVALYLAAAARARALALALVFVPLLVSATTLGLAVHVGADASETLQKAAALALMVALAVVARVRLPPWPITALLAVYAVLLLVGLAQILLGSPLPPEVAVRAAAGYVLPWLLFTVRLDALGPRPILTLLAWLPVAALALGVVLQVADITPLVAREYTGIPRLSGGLDPAYLASFGMFGTFAAAWLWFEVRGRAFAWVVVDAAVTFATGTRGDSIVVAFVVAAVLVFGRPRHRVLSPAVRWTCVVLVAVVTAIALPTLIARSEDQGVLQGPLSGRATAWPYFFHVFLQHPILGNGIGASSIAGGRSSMAIIQTAFLAPHNTYLQFLVDFGVVGTAALLATFTVIFARSIRRSAGSTRLLLVLLAIGAAFYAFFDNLLTSPQPAFAFALLLVALTMADHPGDRLVPLPPQGQLD